MRLIVLFTSLLLLHVGILAKESLYLHLPSPLPTNSASTTSYGDNLLNLIDGAKKEISFAIYGIRGQNDIVQALLAAQKRGVKIKGVVDSDSHCKFHSHVSSHFTFMFPPISLKVSTWKQGVKCEMSRNFLRRFDLG